MAGPDADSPFPIRAFPYWVALGSLCFALWLFFSNTVGALRERQGLRGVQLELDELREQYERAIGEAQLDAGPQRAAGSQHSPRYDLQALLVAIDRQGFTPTELCQAHPQKPIESARSEPARAADRSNRSDRSGRGGSDAGPATGVSPQRRPASPRQLPTNPARRTQSR
ncbi:MAG: hypothetical protein AB8H80_18725 [Planctomycetota bacterium]